MSHQKKKGRPLASPLPRDNFVSLRLNSVEAKALNDYAWRYDMSMGEVIRQALMILSVIPEVKTSKGN